MYKIFSVVGVTAAGKDHAADHINKKFKIKRIPTVTSREPRKNEKATICISKDEYEKLVKLGEFFEYTEFDGNYYGKLKKDINKHIRKDHALYQLTIKLLPKRGIRNIL